VFILHYDCFGFGAELTYSFTLTQQRRPK